MGTRSLTVFQEENETEIVVMYRQFDGYPEGHGSDLAGFLSGMQIVNGLRLNDPEKTANGMGCLAAQVIAHFKEEAGGFYLHPAGARDCGEEYRYVVRGQVGEEPTIEIVDVGWNAPDEILFSGPASEAATWCKNQ